MEWNKDGFSVSTEKAQLQVPRIHRFLSTQAYWSLEIPLSVVQKAIDGSLCFGLYAKSGAELVQIGFARVVTDKASFAWLCDVYVENEYRGQGLAKWLIGCVKSHPDLQNLRRFCLATRDAHSLYRPFGFAAIQNTENWMEIKDDDFYKKRKGDL